PQSGLLLDEWLMNQHGQAMLVQLDPARPNQIWMLRAPGSDISAIASAIVAARTTTESPRGQVSVLGYDGQWHSWIAPDRQPVLLEPISLGNIRHVVGNFVSAMPIRYVTGLFFLALISALFALRLVISSREHRS
ncbi:MAG: cellulose synthase, partial [Rhodobacteraceae bacterium]|nr:cellulose synthase [Paracoccaceae bacterium]